MHHDVAVCMCRVTLTCVAPVMMITHLHLCCVTTKIFHLRRHHRIRRCMMITRAVSFHTIAAKYTLLQVTLAYF